MIENVKVRSIKFVSLCTVSIYKTRNCTLGSEQELVPCYVCCGDECL